MSYQTLLLIMMLAALLTAIYLRGDVGLVIVAMVVAIWLVLPLRLKAQDLEAALSRRLTVWTVPKTGTPVHVVHCARTKGGCSERVRAFAVMFENAGKAHGIDPYLLAAMALKESGLSPAAHGSVGERGVLQIHPRSRHAHGLKFISSETYRKRCLRRADACQAEIVDRAALVLSRSVVACGGDLEAALGRYQSGRCDASRPYVRRVLAIRAVLLGEPPPTRLGSGAYASESAERGDGRAHRARESAAPRPSTQAFVSLRAR